MLRPRVATGARTHAQKGQARLALVFAAALCGGGYLTAAAVGGTLTSAHSHVTDLDRTAPPAAAAQSAHSATAVGGAINGVVSRPGARLSPSAIPMLHANAVTLPGSDIASGEPSLAIDSTGSFYVTAPTGIGHPPTISASPLWKSSDGGSSFTGPINTGTGGETVAEVGGGDSDLVTDSSNNLYLVSLWLGNSSMSVSTDGGTTFIQQPLGHTTPVDDRPWLAYDPVADNMYMAWDGGDGIHVAKATLRAATSGTTAAPLSSLVFVQDTVAVPEVIVGGTPAGAAARECVCPPGGLAVDPGGNLYVAYSSQNGVGVATSTDQGLTWAFNYVPDTKPSGGAAQLDYIFQPVKSDAAGNLYVVFSTTAVNQRQQVFVSYQQHGTSSWSRPIQVSATADGVLGALAVVSPGVVDVAYYGTEAFAGDPNGTPDSVEWSVYLAQARDLFGTPTVLTAEAYPSVHSGVISTGGVTGSGDRSMGDFFSIVVDGKGMAGIVTAAGTASSGTHLVFIHQTADTFVAKAPTLYVAPPAPAPVTIAPPAPTAAPAAAAPAAPAAPTGGPDSGTATSGKAADAAPAAAVGPPIEEPRALAHAGDSGGAPLANPLLALAALVAVTAAAGVLLHQLNRRG